MVKRKSSGSERKKGKKTRKLLQVVLLLISLTAIIYFLGNYHFIRTSERTYVIPKLHFSFRDTSVDMRKWSPLDLFYHTEVEKAIIKNGGERLRKQIQQELSEE
jgi:hypothetical protein